MPDQSPHQTHQAPNQAPDRDELAPVIKSLRPGQTASFSGNGSSFRVRCLKSPEPGRKPILELWKNRIPADDWFPVGIFRMPWAATRCLSAHLEQALGRGKGAAR